MASYSEKKKVELIDIICKEISKGRSLRSVLRDKGMPEAHTFYAWIDDNKERLQQYACACEDRAESIFEDILSIADNPLEGVVIETDDHGRTKEKKGDMLGHRRLQVDSRKWILSKMQPKKYGDKLEVEQTNKGLIQFENVSTQFPDKNNIK
ncbi:terminase small subunit protein [Candidatus Pacearchaeota archaeon]|nr:terminase small subunit protein [Candidatus Pacearchaeota archaeon]